MGVDWGTVSTSLLTSGGVLFAAYKLWFQRRLEDHKMKLENNSKLFEIEIEMLKELSEFNSSVQTSSLDIRKKLAIPEAFASKHHEYLDALKSFRKKYAFILSTKKLKSLNQLIESMNTYSENIAQNKSSNTTYCARRYPVYDDLSDGQNKSANEIIQSVNTFFENLQKDIFSLAGR